MAKKLNSAKLKKKLWAIFGEYIRLRDAPYGFGNCISCEKQIPYPNGTGAFHAGHYLPRSTTFANLYFDERNVNGQCNYCNTFLEGNTHYYAIGLEKKYGSDIFAQLEYEAQQPFDPTVKFTYEDKIIHYKELVKELKANYGI